MKFKSDLNNENNIDLKIRPDLKDSGKKKLKEDGRKLVDFENDGLTVISRGKFDIKFRNENVVKTTPSSKKTVRKAINTLQDLESEGCKKKEDII